MTRILGRNDIAEESTHAVRRIEGSFDAKPWCRITPFGVMPIGVKQGFPCFANRKICHKGKFSFTNNFPFSENGRRERPPTIQKTRR